MSEPTDPGGDPPPEPATEPVSDFAALDAREEFFTGTLQHATRMVNTAEAVRVQLLLAGLEAMALEEEAQTGQRLRMDDPVVIGFYQHQAHELRTTRFDIKRRLEAAMMLRDHLPATWAAFLAGLTSETAAGIAAAQAVGLQAPEHYAVFDAQAAELVQQERPSVIERKLADLRVELDPDAARARHRTAANRRYVRARATSDGQGVLEIHSTAADIAAAYDRIRKHAVAAHGREAECRTLGNLMADGAIDAILTGRMHGPAEGGPSHPMERLGETCDPTRHLIDATILVVVPAETATGATDQPATLAGMGAVDGETARTIVTHTRTWTRVAIDPIDDTVLGIDSHERYIPAGLKKLLHLRQPTCGCGCGLPAHRADWAPIAGTGATPKAAGRPCDGDDHIERVEHDGRTRHDNLQILCRASHQAKDLGHQDVRMMADGTIRWHDKWGGTRTTRPTIRIRTATYPDNPPF